MKSFPFFGAENFGPGHVVFAARVLPDCLIADWTIIFSIIDLFNICRVVATGRIRKIIKVSAFVFAYFFEAA
jgi:hypothetical protein